MSTNTNNPTTWAERMNQAWSRKRHDDLRTDVVLSRLPPEAAAKVAQRVHERDQERERESRKARSQELVASLATELAHARKVATVLLPKAEGPHEFATPREAHIAVIKHLSPTMMVRTGDSDAYVAGVFAGLIESREVQEKLKEARTDQADTWSKRLDDARERSRAGAHRADHSPAAPSPSSPRPGQAPTSWANRLDQARNRRGSRE